MSLFDAPSLLITSPSMPINTVKPVLAELGALRLKTFVVSYLRKTSVVFTNCAKATVN